MSHTTTLKGMKIRDVKALQAAVAGLSAKGIKCSLVENQKPRMYYSGQGEVCSYVLKLHDSQYDVGFQKSADGSYDAVMDTWNDYVAKEIGADRNVCAIPPGAEGRAQHAMGQFLQQYGLHAAINQATDEGYIVEGHSYDDKGNLQLSLLVN